MENTIQLKNGLTQDSVKVRQSIAFLLMGLIPATTQIFYALVWYGFIDLWYWIPVFVNDIIAGVSYITGCYLLLNLSSNKPSKLLLVSLSVFKFIVLFWGVIIILRCTSNPDINYNILGTIVNILCVLATCGIIYTMSICIKNNQTLVKNAHKSWLGLYLAMLCMGFIAQTGALDLFNSELKGLCQWFQFLWGYLIEASFVLIFVYKLIHCGIFEGTRLANDQEINFSPLNKYFIGALSGIVIVILMCCAINYFADEINGLIPNVNKQDIILKK